MLQSPVFRPIYSAITGALSNKRATEVYADIIGIDGQLASFATFTRSSTATRYNSAGLLETVAANAPRYDYDPTTVTRANLLTWSEFNNGVTDAPIRGGSVSATTLAGYSGALSIGYDGVASAYAYKTFAHIAGATYTFSVIVQMTDGLAPSFANAIPASGLNSLILVANGQAPAVASEYLVTMISTGIYRISWTYVASGTNGNTGVSKAPTNDNRTFKVTGYQLEVGSTATAYIPTTASPAGDATLRGLLIEEQRTNWLRYTADFTNAVWNITAGATVVNNIDGSGTLTTNGSGTETIFSQSASGFAIGNTLTSTIEIRAVSYTGDINIDLQEATPPFPSTTVTITPTSQWQKVTITRTLTVTTGGVIVRLRKGSTTVGGSLQIRYPQLEAGAFATSYIPTTTAAVTRAADVASVPALSSIGFNPTEGTLFAQASFMAPAPNTSVQGIVSIQNNAFTNIHLINRQIAGSLFGISVDSGVNQALTNTGLMPTNTAFKTAYAYKANDFGICTNGGTPVTDNAGTVASAFDAMLVGNAGSILNGHIRRLRYYNRRLSNAQLQALTT